MRHTIDHHHVARRESDGTHRRTHLLIAIQGLGSPCPPRHLYGVVQGEVHHVVAGEEGHGVLTLDGTDGPAHQQLGTPVTVQITRGPNPTPDAGVEQLIDGLDRGPRILQIP